MELTEEQIEFLDKVCGDRRNYTINENGEVDVAGSVNMNSMGLTEIPVKFNKVYGEFRCSYNNLTTLKNCPNYLSDILMCNNNNLTDYFKSIKEEDFPLWNKLFLERILKEYPFLINILKKYFVVYSVRFFLNKYPLTKIYYKD